MVIKTRWIVTIVLTTALSIAVAWPALAADRRSSVGSTRSNPSGSAYRPVTPTMPNTRQSTSLPAYGRSFSPTQGNAWRNNRWNHVTSSANKFPYNKNSPYWKKYGGWGHWWGPWYPWGIGFGWGWGAWYSPWCYWPYYQPIAVADYANPYTSCSSPIVDGIDYSVPISQMPADSATADGANSFDAGRAAFLQGDFNSALGWAAQACRQTPHNHDAHQLHSLVLFAMKDYCRSAIIAYAVLQDGPGWTWDQLQSFYSAPNIYTGELRDLEHYVTANPSDANVRVLLSYHYLMLNHTDSAGRQLANAVALQPADKLAPRIRAGVTETTTANQAAADNSQAITTGQPTGPTPSAPAPSGTNGSPSSPGPAPSSPAPSSPSPPPAPVPGSVPGPASNSVPGNPANSSSVTGTWKANPEQNVQIELALRDNGTFNWKFTANGRPKAFAGKYTLNGTTLALIRDTDGDAMEGTFKRIGDNSFQFRMKDADNEDPGLNFTR